MEDLQNTFEARIFEHTKEFLSLKGKVAPDEESVLKKEREMLRPDTVTQAIKHLQSAYKDNFDYSQFANAKSYVFDLLNETERVYSIRQRLEQAKNQYQKSLNYLFHVTIKKFHYNFYIWYT